MPVLTKTPRGQVLDRKEFLLIQEISRQPTVTQRDLSQSLGLSLGMTNLLIKRLSRKGLIKITQLDWKRTQYLLTLQGAVEKARKSYDYTLYTLRIFRQLQENITAVLRREYTGGRRTFHLVAQDELLDLVSATAAELKLAGAELVFHRALTQVPASADLILTATHEAAPKSASGPRRVSLVDFDNIDFRL
ncbi:MAG: winged helix-turn-helix transcriptional regulator [Elusimicrobiota bacterium]